MNWIKLSERKPGLALKNVLYSGNGLLLGFYSTPPLGATHWMVIYPPDLDEPAIGHFNFTSNRTFSGDVVSNVNEPIKIKEKPKDLDWAKFDEIYKDAGLNFKINAIYEFLKAKYDSTD